MYFNTTKFLNFNKVLCLSPHPDDIEISMSATISKFSDTKFDILCLSHGTSTDITSTSNRILEVERFWQLLQCNNITLIRSDVKYFESMSSAQWITYLDKIVANNYDAICTTSAHDSHQEHILEIWELEVMRSNVMLHIPIMKYINHNR